MKHVITSLCKQNVFSLFPFILYNHGYCLHVTIYIENIIFLVETISTTWDSTLLEMNTILDILFLLLKVFVYLGIRILLFRTHNLSCLCITFALLLQILLMLYHLSLQIQVFYTIMKKIWCIHVFLNSE